MSRSMTIERALFAAVALASTAGCLLFRHLDEQQVSGALVVENEAAVEFPNVFEPAYWEFAVCLKLPKGYRRVPSGWDILGPDSTVTSVTLESRVGSERIPFTAPEFLRRDDGTFACFHEATGPGPAAKRKYTGVSIHSTRPLAVEAVVVRSYDPK
jgi:hypothetical protein